MKTTKLLPEYGWYKLTDLPPNTRLDKLLSSEIATVINKDMETKRTLHGIPLRDATIGKLHVEPTMGRLEFYMFTNSEMYAGAIPPNGIQSDYTYSWTLGDFNINPRNVKLRASEYEDANYVFVKLHESKLKIQTSILTKVITND